MPTGDKIAFAHILRGLAALIVLIGHLCHTFWMLPSISTMLGAPVMPLQPNWFTGAVDQFLPPGFMGHFGVALFFLISGFVIPFSLLGRTRLQFGVSRILRLWPTYAIGLTFTVLLIIACSTWFKQAQPFAWSTYWYQMLMIRDLVWVQSIDGIVWTLEIEAKFYLLSALLAAAMREGRVWPLIATAVALSCLSLGASRLPQWLMSGDLVYRALYGLTLSSQMICYMLIGTLFNFLYRRLVTLNVAVPAMGALFATMAVQWPVGVISQKAKDGIFCYAIALVVFAVCYVGRDRMVRVPAVLSRLADISYPLYVIHGMAGYALMRMAFDAGLGHAGCIAMAMAFAFVASMLLHRYVELPTQAFGKALSRRLAAGTRPQREHQRPNPPIFPQA